MVKAILFDLFGTLMESGTRSPTKQSLNILRIRLPYHRFIVPFEHVFMTKTYDSQSDAFIAVCQHFRVRPHPVAIEKLIGVWNKNKILAQPYEETFEILTKLRKDGYKLGLICNLDSFSFDFLKEKFELDTYFDVLLPSCQTGYLKLNTQSFDNAALQLGIPKQEILMVGDSFHSDIKAADAAGVRSVMVDRRDTREYQPRIHTLNELEKHL